jgi:anti-sigma factor NepR-like protein
MGKEGERMSRRSGLTSTDRSEGTEADAARGRTEEEGTPEQARPSERPQRVKLRIVYNKDAQQGAHTMNPRPPSPPADEPKATLDRELQTKIGRMLRDIFSDVAQEPIPERLVKLLEALGEKERDR